MYSGVVLGAGTAVATTTVVTMLPNTGSNMLLNVAVSLASGMVVWGIVFVRTRIR